MQQPLLSSQPTTILGSQPLYIRTAEPFVQQQTPSLAVANVQAVAPIRSKLQFPLTGLHLMHSNCTLNVYASS